MAQQILDVASETAAGGWPAPDPDARAIWRAERLVMERTEDRFSPWGVVRRGRIRPLHIACTTTFWTLDALGLKERVTRASLDVRAVDLELAFANLPRAFDGYQLLQIADPHFDSLPGLAAAIADAAAECAPDLVVLTGDYRADDVGDLDRPLLVSALRRLDRELAPPDGVLAILGNHDTASMVPVLEEEFGIRVLTNERVWIRRGADALEVVGTDDAHRFFGHPSADFLANLPVAEGFRLALVHSPELAGPMAERGASLYLSGHTHAGQICLPGGRPLIRQLHREHGLAKGLWQRGRMTGYTSAGAGVSWTLPLRINSRSEVVRIRLRRGSSGTTSKG